jgi:hypothetical protein
MGPEPKPSSANEPPQAADRSERRHVSLQALITRRGGKVAEVTLLDLSHDGCGIETPVELSPGEAVTLSVSGRGSLPTVVRWYRDGHAGLQFEAEEAPPKEQKQRSSPRIPVSVDVTLRRVGQRQYQVRVTDLSPEGCKVDLVERPRVGEHMHLKLEGLEVIIGEVCWIEGFVAGLRFEKPIHHSVFDLLVERLTSQA